MSTEKRLNARLIQKHDTEANWNTASNNGFVPLMGEIIFYTDLNMIKIGDGETVVGNLDFLVPDITTITTAEIDEICAGTLTTFLDSIASEEVGF